MKKSILFGLFLITPLLFYGQSADKAVTAGLRIGTSGIGAQFTYGISEKLNIRLAGSYFVRNTSVKDSILQDKSTYLSDKKNTYKIGHVGLFLDWQAFENISFIRLTGGVLYNLLKVKNVETVTQNTVNEVTRAVTKSKDVGTLTMDVKPNVVSPYVGLVIGNPAPDSKVSVLFEMGTYYLGSPKVTWKGEGDIAPTAEQAPLVQKNIKNYSWFPHFSLQLNYRIK